MGKRTQIESALAAIVQALNGTTAAWVAGGSTGLMLRGLPLPAEPNDIDLYTDDEDYDLIYERLEPYAADTKHLSECGSYRSMLSHFVIEGVSVELVGGFVVRAKGCRYVTEVQSLLGPSSELVVIQHEGRDIAVPVVPLAHELWFNVLRNREDRIQLIVEHYIMDPSRHETLRLQLEKRNVLTVEAKKQLTQRLADSQAGVAR
jgi:hypothetical protein